MFSNSASSCIIISPNSHLFVAAEPIADFPGRSRHRSIVTMNKKELKQLLAGLTHANIAVRNFPLSVAQLRKKLKLKDGGNTYCSPPPTPRPLT